MLKIAQVVCVFPPYRGGIGNSVYYLAKMLTQAGERVTVFTPKFNRGPRKKDCFEAQDLRSFLKFGNAACLPQLIWKLKGFDIIHLHLPFLGATLPTIFFSLFHPKTRLIITYHMDLVGWGLYKFPFFIYKKFVLPFALWRADKILVSSFDYLKNSDLAGFWGKTKNKFYEAPFGVDPEKFFPREKNRVLAEKYFIPEKAQVILFVGSLDRAHYFKGLPILMRAVKEILNTDDKKIKLLIVGSGDYLSDYRNLAEELGIAPEIIFAGEVGDDELPAHYNLADVFVLPSVDKSESFGLVLLEAAASGLPLVASNLGGVRTLIEEGQNGFLFEPNNIKELEGKILKILKDENLKKEMGQASRRLAEKKYNWRGAAEKVREIYNVLFTTQGGRR